MLIMCMLDKPSNVNSNFLNTDKLVPLSITILITKHMIFIFHMWRYINPLFAFTRINAYCIIFNTWKFMFYSKYNVIFIFLYLLFLLISPFYVKNFQFRINYWREIIILGYCFFDKDKEILLRFIGKIVTSISVKIIIHYCNHYLLSLSAVKNEILKFNKNS